MKRALRQLQKDWNLLGQEDPLWAILTDERKRGGGWDVAEFFATGRDEVTRVMATLRELGVAPPPGPALDFGCGVGRLTRALAEHFSSVDGVDIAPSMLSRARELNAAQGRCRFVLSTSEALEDLDGAPYAFIYSVLTLQHMEQALIRGYLVALVRRLRPGGVLWFQLPGEQVGRPWWRRRLRALTPAPVLRLIGVMRHGRAGRMQMFGLPRAEVEALLAAQGCRLVAVEPDAAAGPTWGSFHYCAVKA